MDACRRVPIRLMSLTVAALATCIVAAGPSAVFAQTAAAKQTPPPAAKATAPAAKPVAPAAKPAAPATKPAAPATPQAAPAGQTPKPVAASSLASLAGNWDGAAQTSNGDLPMRIVLAVTEGKLTGSIETAMGTLGITGATLTGDVLELGIEMQGTAGGISGKVAGNSIEGSWSVGSESGSFAVKRAAVAGAKVSAEAATPAAADPISGAWDGNAEVGGQSYAITLTLKLNGETVTGEISSAAGSTPLTPGTWKQGTLQFSFPYAGGEPIGMTAQLVDGKLSGAVSVNNGDLQGTWTAVRKK